MIRAHIIAEKIKKQEEIFLLGTGGAPVPIDLRFLKNSVAPARIA